MEGVSDGMAQLTLGPQDGPGDGLGDAVAPCHFARLAGDLIRRVASFLHANDVAANLKLVCRETAACLWDYNKFVLAQKPTQAGDPVLAQPSWPGRHFVAHWGNPERWDDHSAKVRHTLLCLAASSNHPPSLEVALQRCGCTLDEYVLVSAAAAGNLDGCERLLMDGCPLHAWRVAYTAAKRGHLHVLQWLDKSGWPLDDPARDYATWDSATAGAFSGGHRNVVDWLEQRLGAGGQTPWWGPEKLAAHAAEAGHVALLERLAPLIRPRNCPQRQEVLQTTVAAIARGCPLEVLQRYYHYTGEAGVSGDGSSSSGSGSSGSSSEGSSGGQATAGADVAREAGAGGGGASDANAGGGSGGPGGGIWVGRTPLRGARARYLLSAALASPLPDWSEKLDWLLSQCDHGWHDGAPMQVHVSVLLNAPEDCDGCGDCSGGGSGGGGGGSGGGGSDGGGSDGGGGSSGGGGGSRGLTTRLVNSHCAGSSDGQGRDCGCSRHGGGFSARLAALRQRRLALDYTSDDVRPGADWIYWSKNGVALLTHLLFEAGEMLVSTSLLMEAARERCLPLLRLLLAAPALGVARWSRSQKLQLAHAMLTGRGAWRGQSHLPDSRLRELLGLMREWGLLQMMAAPGADTPPAPEAEAEAQAVEAARQRAWDGALASLVAVGMTQGMFEELERACGTAVPGDLKQLVVVGGSVKLLQVVLSRPSPTAPVSVRCYEQ